MDILDFEPIIMIAEIGPREAGPPTHFHPFQEESYEVLEGEAEFVLAGKKMIVRKLLAVAGKVLGYRI